MEKFDLPANLPVPVDDGACDHLKQGLRFPVELVKNLSTTNGQPADFSSRKRTVVYFYPRSGVPNQKLPDGWDEIPGARGCTPQSCAFRDHFKELEQLDVNVYGCSTQTTEYQQEFKERNHFPFDLISDSKFELLKALNLPFFSLAELDNTPLIKRLTIVVRNELIEHVFYPIFPPDRHAAEVLDWIRSNPIGQ